MHVALEKEKNIAHKRTKEWNHCYCSRSFPGEGNSLHSNYSNSLIKEKKA